MAKVASPTGTEGLGTTYADKAAAFALLCLLEGSEFGEHDLGFVTKVQFGQRPAGWHYDDILLTLDRYGESRYMAISVKSASQINSRRIAKEIVDRGWLQISDPGLFIEGRDIQAIVQPSIPPAQMEALDKITKWATEQESSQLETWLQPNVSNATMRNLAQSGNGNGDEQSSQRFFRSFRTVFLDLESPRDSSTQSAIRRCLQLLSHRTERQADSLWLHLCQLAQRRTSAGYFDLPKLVAELTPHFQLRAHPRVEVDLQKMRDFSRTRHLSDVKDVIGLTLRLPTTDGIKQVEKAIGECPYVIFVGPSGIGKSVVLKHYVEQAPENEYRLYFRAELNSLGPAFLAQQLGLQHSIVECLREGRFYRITIVIDQVDRLLNEQISDVIELIESTKDLNSSVRLVFGCQSAEAERTISRIRSATGSEGLLRVDFEINEEAIFKEVLKTFPQLHNLGFRPELRQVLLRPVHLDLFVCKADSLAELKVTSQKQFIDWFWKEYVANGPQGITKAMTMRRIAEVQAETLSPRVNPVMLEPGNGVDVLRSESLVSGDDQGIAFNRDLYGDWARLRIIDDHRVNLTDFFKDRGINPLWLRALRLWSAVVLETEGAAIWKTIFEEFQGNDASAWLVRDALLDGISQASDSYQYLTELHPVLVANGGRLLRRFLVRFLFSSSTPNDRLINLVEKHDGPALLSFRAEVRQPHFYLWLPVLRYVIENNVDCRTLARDLTVQVIFPWLEVCAPTREDPLASRCAELALGIFTDYLQEVHRRNETIGVNFKLFRCLFLSLGFLPVEAMTLIKSGLGLCQSNVSEDSLQESEDEFDLSPGSLYVGSGRAVGPWPGGPILRAPEEFRTFVLRGGGIGEMYRHDPKFAEEVIFGASIMPPHKVDFGHLMPDPCNELSIVDERLFHPPLYDRGVFPMMFNLDFDWATEIVLRLVRFAVEREAELYRARGHDDGFTLVIDGQERGVLGSTASFAWSRGELGCPDLITSALMSLEWQLYKRIDEGVGDDVLDKLIDTLDVMPIVGLLVSIAKKYQHLNTKRLRFLHFNESIHWIDSEVTVKVEHDLMGWWSTEHASEIASAKAWHEQPYRKGLLKLLGMLVLTSSEGVDSARAACVRWQNLIGNYEDQDEIDRLRNLIAIYSVESYKYEEIGDKVAIRCQLPEDLLAKGEKHQEKAERSFRLLFVPHECRKILDGNQDITEEQILNLVSETHLIDNNDVLGGGWLTDADFKCGVAAVLIVKFPQLLLADPELSLWTTEVLVETVLNPPPKSEYDSDLSPSNYNWFHFVAQALPFIWLSTPMEKRLRVAMATIIEETHYNTAMYLAHSLFTIRKDNVALYGQALNLFRYRAIDQIREIEEDKASRYSEYEVMQLAWPSYAAKRKTFIDGTLEEDILPLPQPIPIEPRDSSRGVGHHRNRARTPLNDHRLAYFVLNLPWRVLPANEFDLREVIERFNEFFEFLIADVRNGNDMTKGSVSIHRFEYEFFSACGSIACRHQDADLMRSWASSIESITPVAEHHSEQFLVGILCHLLFGDHPTAIAEENWKVAVETFLGTRNPTKETWTKHLTYHDWKQWLVGNTSSLRLSGWKVSHQPFLLRNKQIYESWCREATTSTRSLKQCLLLLQHEAFAVLRAEACIWLDEELKGDIKDGYNNELVNEMASFLASTRPLLARGRMGQSSAFRSFLNLTAALNVKNNRLAMQLYEDVATLA